MENANQNEDGGVHLSCEEDDDDFIVVTPVTPVTRIDDHGDEQG